MNNCQRINEQISLYIDDMLDEKELIIFNEHIKHCQSCKEELETMRLIVNSASAIEEAEPPSNFSKSLREKIEKEAKNQHLNDKWYTNWRVYSAVAAAILIAVAMNSNIFNNITQKYYSGSSTESALNMDKDKTYSINDLNELEVAQENNTALNGTGITSQETQQAQVEDGDKFSATEEQIQMSVLPPENSQLSIMREEQDDALTDRSLEPGVSSTINPSVMKRTNTKLVIKKVIINTIPQNMDKIVLELENNTNLNYIVNYSLQDSKLTINILKDNTEKFLEFLEEKNIPIEKRIITDDVTDKYLEYISRHEELIKQINAYESEGELDDLDRVRNELKQIETEINNIVFYSDKVSIQISTESS